MLTHLTSNAYIPAVSQRSVNAEQKDHAVLGLQGTKKVPYGVIVSFPAEAEKNDEKKTFGILEHCGQAMH